MSKPEITIDLGDLTHRELEIFMLYEWVNQEFKYPTYPVFVAPTNRSWDGLMYQNRHGKKTIYIARGCLKYPEKFLGVYLHEMAHALWNHNDKTLAFESDLTSMLGMVALKGLGKRVFKPAVILKSKRQLNDDLFDNFCEEFGIFRT